MASGISVYLKRTLGRIKRHPQLFWTLSVAVAITVGFIIIAHMFISIAQDAQERLVNVRVGAMQDSLAQFVNFKDESKEQIDQTIVNLMEQNPTILDFTFYKKTEEGFVVFASSYSERVGEVVEEISFSAQLAVVDTKNSYTTQGSNELGRLYQTHRAIAGGDGAIIGFIETTQTISQADKVISQNIQRGILIFILILLLVMFLFFRHSRIIDYGMLYGELKKIDKLKDDFISMASHELRTPLTTIRGYNEYILEADGIEKEYKEYAQRIDTSAYRLVLLIEDMLDVSRIEQGRLDLHVESILVPELLTNMQPDFEALARDKNLHFDVEHAGLKYSYIKADENRLRQVLTNLVGNAIKYTKKGEVTMRLENEVGGKQQLRLIIQDTGIGMSEEERAGLFQKFYRVRNAETEEITGTGLGMWITRELIEKMDGTISVESIKGVGTRVVVEFPAFVS